jgi:hypothetical protein
VKPAACALGFDADDILTTLDDDRPFAEAHVAECQACERAARATAIARTTWKNAQRRDDLGDAIGSELRLQRMWPRRVPNRAPVFAFGAIAGACVAAAVAIVVAKDRVPAAPAPVAALASPPAATQPAPTTDPPAIKPSPRAIVAANPCSECRVNDTRFEPGARLDGKRVEVPAGARLTLGFSLPDGLVDPASGADVAGPATPRIDATEIVLERGTARVRSANDVVLVVPGARLSATGATFTVRVDDHGRAHVDVERGKVIVASGTGSVAHAQGRSFEIAPEKAPPSGKAPPAALPKHLEMDPESFTAPPVDKSNVLRAGLMGEASTEREELERTAVSSDARAARRATFTLAELDLAVGDTGKARERLSSLLSAPDPALAHDAATLLARSYPSASQRASAWGRYLATTPSAPYFERGLLARAEALLDAGETAEAKRILNELQQTPRLGPAEKQRLARLLLKAR